MIFSFEALWNKEYQVSRVVVDTRPSKDVSKINSPKKIIIHLDGCLDIPNLTALKLQGILINRTSEQEENGLSHTHAEVTISPPIIWEEAIAAIIRCAYKTSRPEVISLEEWEKRLAGYVPGVSQVPPRCPE